MNKEMLSNGSIICGRNNFDIVFVINKLGSYINYNHVNLNIKNKFSNELEYISDYGSVFKNSSSNISRIYNTGNIVDSFILLKELLLTDTYYSMHYYNIVHAIYDNIKWTYKNKNNN